MINAALPNTSLFYGPNNYKIKETKKLTDATNENGVGPVDELIVKKYFNKLQANAAPGVAFKAEYISNYCSGGTCSAKVLSFANDFFNSKAANLHERVLNAAERHITSSHILRTQQAALNTISKDEKSLAKDFSRAKVESIVALEDFVVEEASKPIPKIEYNFDENLFGLSAIEMLPNMSFENFEEVFDQLKDGFYFCRMLASSDNFKDEYYGHSVAFIKHADGNYLWDSTGGLIQIADYELKKKSYDLFNELMDKWGLDIPPRFYRLRKMTPSAVDKIDQLAIAIA